MIFDIQEQARRAQANLQEALAALSQARADYETGAGATFAQAKAAQEELASKIKTAEAEADAASDAFNQAFSAGGFVNNEASRAAMARKKNAQDIAIAVHAAFAQGAKALQEHACSASVKARLYASAYEKAYIAHAQAEGYKALQEFGPHIARAMALAAHAPHPHSVHEDSLGRPAPTAAIRRETVAARWAFILEALQSMAKECPDFIERPLLEELGAFDLGALTPAHTLTPVQMHKMRSAAGAAL